MALRTMMGRPRPGQMQPGAFAERSTNTLIVFVDKQHAPFVDMLIAKLEMTKRPISEPRMYELQHVRAEMIADSVDAMLKAKVAEREGQRKQQTVYTAVLTAPGSNRLVVFAPDDYHALATEMIRMLDEEVDSGEIVHIIQLDNADAVNLAQSINQTLSSGGGQSFGGGRRGSRFNRMPSGGSSDRQVTVTPDADSNSLIVSGLPKDVAYVEDLIKELELKSTNIAELQIFTLEYSSAFDVADTLTALFPPGRDASDMVTVTPDPYYNKVIVTANKRKMRIVEGYLAQLDKSPYDAEGNYVGNGGKKLFFVDVIRGDAFDIAMDVSDLYPPEGGPEIDADWFGEYIKVLCRESEFPRIMELIREYDARARVPRTMEIRDLKGGDIASIVAFLKDRDPDLKVEVPDGGQTKRKTIVETLWDDDEEPPFKAELERKRNKVRKVKQDVDPMYIDMAFAQAWFSGTLEWDDVQDSDEPQDADTAKVEPSDSTKQDNQAQNDKPVRERAKVQFTPDGRIIISGPERAVDDVNEILDLMEEEIGAGEVIRIFKFKYGDVTSASQILNQMFNERVVVARQQPQQQRRGQQGQQGQGQQGQQGNRGQQQGGQAALLQQLMGAARQGGGSSRSGGSRVRIATDPGHNYLIVKCDESLLPEIRQLLRELDIPPGQVDINVIQLKNLDAAATAQNIKEVLGIGTTRGRTQRAPQARGGNQQQQLMQVLQQQLVTMQSGTGGAAKIESVEIVPNVVTNSLMVSAPPDVMEIIVGVIADLEELEAGDNIVIRYYEMRKGRV
ncbi:MAG: hypothetical protein IID33_15910, partial [Planctomycetes bacterium]|nr:hypothetical protein [Planctomycetota bacterium]